MKIFIVIILALLLLVSCTEIKFEVAQPRGIKALDIFPESIQGRYLIDKNDTLVVNTDSFIFLSDSSTKQVYKLSNSLVLKQWKKSYFINLKADKATYWSVIFITKNKAKKMSIGMLNFSDKNRNKINKITSVKIIKDKDSTSQEYVINPSRRELKKILNNSSFLELGFLQKLE